MVLNFDDMATQGSRQVPVRPVQRKEISEPRGEGNTAADCWTRRSRSREIVAREFALKRYIRAHSAEKYSSTTRRFQTPVRLAGCVDDGYDRF